MDNVLIHHRFQSISYVLIHFSCSLVELCCALAILALQITLTVTQTCAYRIGVGFWSFPFLFASPLSIWILLWKRNSRSCCFTFLIHICSTLFATSVIIVSFLALIEQIGSPCSISSSSTNSYFVSVNVSLIVISVFLKVFIYTEIGLLYTLKHYTNEPSSLFDKEFPQKHYRSLSDNISTKLWNPFRSIVNTNPNKTTDLHV